MHRRPLLDLLSAHAARRPDQADVVARIRQLVVAHADCLVRTCVPGHVTASAWVVTPDGKRYLLTHHKKLDRWLQLGGHVDGEPHVELAALREASEESGLAPESLSLARIGGELAVLDVDVHVIPAHGAEPAHEHHDVRFLVVVDRMRLPVVSAESHDVRWLDIDELRQLTDEESVLRLADAGLVLLGER
ncbi:MAG: 8-oxo-dGTP pyrophosphatase MutT (NUDIX family) [Pseudohongiellaceae bacterium]|jgi:8-oxo-dGTP pyrophosphatase MutT (NUDIX family)